MMAKPRMTFSFGKIGAREKAWIVVWVAVILSIGYLRVVYRPRAVSLRDIRDQISSAERQKGSLLAKRPDIEKKQETIKTLKGEITKGFEALTAAEKNLLNDQDVDELLESLVKDRGRFEMVLNSIRPLQQKEPSAVERTKPDQAGSPAAEPYRHLLVQMDLFSTFQGLVSYVDFLEQMRPYQEVQNLKVKVEGKDVSRPHAIIQVSVLMGQTAPEKEESRREIFSAIGEAAAKEAKDPFLTGEKPKEVVPAVGLRLSGIFEEGGRPVSALINGEVYGVGQMIQGKRIVAVEPNQVVLEQGNRRFILVPNQGQQEGGSAR